jgi:hypothetical protein
MTLGSVPGRFAWRLLSDTLAFIYDHGYSLFAWVHPFAHVEIPGKPTAAASDAACGLANDGIAATFGC